MNDNHDWYRVHFFNRDKALSDYMILQQIWTFEEQVQNKNFILQYYCCTIKPTDNESEMYCQARLKVVKDMNSTDILVFKNEFQHNHDVLRHCKINEDIVRLYKLGFNYTLIKSKINILYRNNQISVDVDYIKEIVKNLDLPHEKISKFVKSSQNTVGLQNEKKLMLQNSQFIPIMTFENIINVIDFLENDKYWKFEWKNGKKNIVDYFFTCAYVNSKTQVQCDAVLLIKLNINQIKNEECIQIFRTILYHDHKSKSKTVQSTSSTSAISKANSSNVADYKGKTECLYKLGFNLQSIMKYFQSANSPINFINKTCITKHFNFLVKQETTDSLISRYRNRWWINDKRENDNELLMHQNDWTVDQTFYSIEDTEKVLGLQDTWIFTHSISTLSGFHHYYRCNFGAFEDKPCFALIYLAFNATTMSIRLYKSRMLHNHVFEEENILKEIKTEDAIVLGDESNDGSFHVKQEEAQIVSNVMESENNILTSKLSVVDPNNPNQLVEYVISEVLEDDQNVVPMNIDDTYTNHIDWENQIDDLIMQHENS